MLKHGGKSGIHIRIIKNEENKTEIWLRMHDIKDKLGVKNVSDLTIKEIEDIYIKKIKILQGKKNKNIKHGLLMDLCIFLVILALNIIKVI